MSASGLFGFHFLRLFGHCLGNQYTLVKMMRISGERELRLLNCGSDLDVFRFLCLLHMVHLLMHMLVVDDGWVGCFCTKLSLFGLIVFWFDFFALLRLFFPLSLCYLIVRFVSKQSKCRWTCFMRLAYDPTGCRANVDPPRHDVGHDVDWDRFIR